MVEDDLKKIRLDILEMIHKAGEGHLPSSFSVVEILYALYSRMGDADEFFLSKGHASAAFYAILAFFGLLERKHLKTYCQYDSCLGGHPHRWGGKVIRNSSGSLGHGFPVAAGYALSKKIREEPGRVFCLVGDGESNEGTIWETAMYAQQLALSNLVCIVDNNNSQVRAMTSINLGGKFRAFGWETREVDGHNVGAIVDAVFGGSYNKAPLCVIARTVKGKGLKALENDYLAWHHKAPGEAEFASFKKELHE